MHTLTEDGCRARQERFRQRLALEGIDSAVLMDPRDVYYFSGVLLPTIFPVCLFVETAGGVWIVSHSDATSAPVDDWLTYEWSELDTLNWDNARSVARIIGSKLAHSSGAHRLGVHAESVLGVVQQSVTDVLHPVERVAVDELLADVQRHKDPDELDMLRRSVAANLASYDATSVAIEPGVNELDVLAVGHRAAMLAAGERLYHDGDYRSGERHGPARDRPIEDGELYIVDAHTCCGGYWSDLARTYSVGGDPTDLQRSIFDHVATILGEVAALLRPDAKGTEIWRRLDDRMREHPALADTGLRIHGGHGIGVRMHEPPDVNRDREGILRAGDVVCVEPGGYTDAARYGVRLENTYLVTESGGVSLSEYPIELVPQTGVER